MDPNIENLLDKRLKSEIAQLKLSDLGRKDNASRIPSAL
jgi:hypothetical protein